MIVSISTKKYWKTFDQILQWNNTIIVLNEPVDCESGTTRTAPSSVIPSMTALFDNPIKKNRPSLIKNVAHLLDHIFVDDPKWIINQIFNLGFRLGFNGNTTQNYVYCRWDPGDPSLEFVSFPFGLFDSIRSFYQNILWRLEFHFDQARAQQIVHKGPCKGCYTNL